MMMSKGIYKITNLINGKIYFGQSINVEKRKLDYFSSNHFPNDYLKNSFRKYGKENFEFELMFECPEDMLDVCEQLLIYLLDTQNREKGYNIDSRGNLRKHCSDETRMKIIKSMGKDYARIIKNGFQNNKQMYQIRFNGKRIKRSQNIHKLINWWNENYLREPLHIE